MKKSLRKRKGAAFAMRLSEIKKGFWGYKKEGISQYIAELEAEVRAKLQEKDEEIRRTEEAAKARTTELEEALRAVRKENEALRAEQASIADALIQAQKYAEQIRKEADEFEREAYARVQAGVDRQRQELEEYAKAADVLKEQLHVLLKDTLGKTEDIQRELNILHDKGPESNLVDINSMLEIGIG